MSERLNTHSKRKKSAGSTEIAISLLMCRTVTRSAPKLTASRHAPRTSL